ncbi:response regulator [Sphingomonas sp. PAMC 26617]|uniref:response regulator n=1 Tax=Sphingomonas sp. PAMC 26617 TaxID=1112216 RepID=UPI001E45CA82|nr:response regulator [Sphingomonas sp. PAMC 26617]
MAAVTGSQPECDPAWMSRASGKACQTVSLGRKILLVEDDVLIAMDLADLLSAMGHDVCHIASTEADAVEAAARLAPDLMIVDGNLAEGSGVSAMRQILARGFVAHFYISGDPNQLLKAVPDAVVLAKPFTMHALANGMAKAALGARRN